MREHTEALSPPRALWVPFMLGRPLGAPGDPAFQRRVLLAALDLFNRPSGPVLEDFPKDAPASTATPADEESAACPVSFPRAASDATLAQAVAAEIDALAMWHALHERRHGRSATGVTRGTPHDAASTIARRIDGAQATADALRLACEELKAYYMESRMAQPGTHGPAELRDWFWHETSAGRLLRALNAATEDDPDAGVRDFSRNYLVPRAVQFASEVAK